MTCMQHSPPPPEGQAGPSPLRLAAWPSRPPLPRPSQPLSQLTPVPGSQALRWFQSSKLQVPNGRAAWWSSSRKLPPSPLAPLGSPANPGEHPSPASQGCCSVPEIAPVCFTTLGLIQIPASFKAKEEFVPEVDLKPALRTEPHPWLRSC